MSAAPLTRLGAFDGKDAPSMDGLRACVHCGICLPQCPTYRVLGEEMDSPRGRVYLMRAAAEDRIGLTPTVAHHLDLCLGCRACETACPSGVPFGQLLEATRGQLERRGVTPPGRDSATLRFLLDVFPHPGRLGPMLHALRMYQWSGMQALVRGFGLLAPFKKLQAMEALLPWLPAPAGPLPKLIPARGPRRGRVGLLVGCVQRFFYPDVNADTARLLSAAGYEVVVPRTQECCGALHLHAGRLDEFRAMARGLIPAFADVDLVVVNAAGCGSALKEYGHWLADDEARFFAERVRDVSELLVGCDLPLRPLRQTVTYHDACHLAHGQRIRGEPRELLRRIPGLTLVDLPDSDLCCGSAGIYNLLQPEMAGELGRRKARRIRETGARVVVAGNPGCLMQMRQHCRAEGLSVEVAHPVTLLARALEER
ncbi:MAG TPA: heterodisulfide reductase-related iron-sulfur binding cluster [Methylomirabilota bacterium]|nr:heterodisulfide reductase-related iron-sulfur binding cluster [Methylomirabilota bacterium]